MPALLIETRDEHGRVVSGRIVCVRMSKRRPSRCSECAADSVYLCDGPVPSHSSGTCDRKLCKAHATVIGRDKHLCTACRMSKESAPTASPARAPARARAQQLGLFDELAA